MTTSLRTPSIFTTLPGASSLDVDQEKASLGLVPIPGDSGSLGVFGRGQTRSQLFAQSRVVTCEADGRVLASDKKLRTPTVFNCANNDSICQRQLFLNQGFIALGNDPTARDVAGFSNTNTNSVNV